eukprot:7032487-Alexandrium_andersonii.AAC.1
MCIRDRLPVFGVGTPDFRDRLASAVSSVAAARGRELTNSGPYQRVVSRRRRGKSTPVRTHG